MTTLLLVHGAWHGSWCWDKVQSRLQRAGRDVVTLDLPGRAGDPTPVGELSLEGYARKVAEVAALRREPVVAVGHSMGGIVISQAAELRPESLFRRLVYLAAFLPRDGTSLLDLAGEAPPGAIPPHLIADPTHPGRLWFRPDAPFREIFYHDCEDADVHRAVAMLVPEPAVASSTPVRLSAARFGSVPRAYVECLQDAAVPLASQRRMHGAAGCTEVVSLDRSHSPFLSAPSELVEAILAVAPEVRGSP